MPFLNDNLHRILKTAGTEAEEGVNMGKVPEELLRDKDKTINIMFSIL